MKFFKIIAIMALLTLASCRPEHYDFDCDGAIEMCHEQVLRALQQLDADPLYPTSVMPRNIAPDGIAWSCRPVSAEEWCSGFWPGILWLDVRNHPNDTTVRRAAIEATMALQPILEQPVFDHDLGFLLFCSAGTGLQALEHEMECEPLTDEAQTADEQLAIQLRAMLLRAADSLATLFNPTVGTILSWPRNVQMFGGHNTIMDNMMNLELLYWAADNGGRKDLAKIATTHANTTMEHHFRKDGSSFHVAVYDTLDGHFIHGVTHQGLADSSMWARGQAWAAYGFTVAFRETGKFQFLSKACQSADVFISQLPADQVPLWDFSAPADAPRDASAAAIVASALLELTTFPAVGPSKAKEYRKQAVTMLKNLTDYYSAIDHNPAFLLHSVGNYPAGSEIDYSIVYADYYYLEALTRLKEIMELNNQD